MLSVRVIPFWQHQPNIFDWSSKKLLLLENSQSILYQHVLLETKNDVTATQTKHFEFKLVKFHTFGSLSMLLTKNISLDTTNAALTTPLRKFRLNIWKQTRFSKKNQQDSFRWKCSSRYMEWSIKKTNHNFFNQGREKLKNPENFQKFYSQIVLMIT